MTRVVLKGVAARKLRAFLTAVAVILGVALMAGTYVLTDTINNSFDQIFAEAAEGVDVAVVPRQAFNSQQVQPSGFDAGLLRKVRRVNGVEVAHGGVFASGVYVFDKKGKRIGTGGAPGFVSSAAKPPFEPYDYTDGRAPRSRSEIALDRQTAKKGDFEIGDRVHIGGAERAERYRIVGLGRLGEVDNFGGATVAIAVLPEAQRIGDRVDRFDQIDITAADGVDPEELKRRIAQVMPREVEVRTGEENARKQSDDVADNLGFLKTALLVFAGIALFVGAFTIFNTFSITVAQRTREFGLLRTIGANRRQVLASVMAEALVIGVVGSAAGLLAGLGMAEGINSLFKAAGIDLPNTGNVVRTRTVVVSGLIGVAITLVAAFIPAIRATHVTPMEALREAPPVTHGRRRILTALAVLLTTGGVAAASIGLFADVASGDGAAALIGLGAGLVFFGVALLSPRLVRPLASLLGRPIERLRGITGRLARENSIRNPGRTAVTAAALMIGLALVTFVTVFAAGIRGSIDSAIERSFQGELTLQNQDSFSFIPPAAAREAAKAKGVERVSSIRFTEAEVKQTGDTSFVSSVDPDTVAGVLEIDWQDGSDATLARLGKRGAIVDDAWADDHGFDTGDKLTATSATGRRSTFVIRGSLKDQADLYGDFAIPERAIGAELGQRQNSLTFIALSPGANEKDVAKALRRTMEERFPAVEVLNQQELKDKQAEQVNQLVGLLYALLSLAIVVSLFGIVNTLTLSIYERTRELGLLRAIGMSRAQVRRVVRYESVITALIGALLGSVLGVFFAVIVSRPLEDEGFSLSFPVPTLIALMVLAALAGVLAAIVPARRAAKLDVLEALAYE